MKASLTGLFYVFAILSICNTIRLQQQQHIIDINLTLDSITDQIYDVLEQIHEVKETYAKSDSSNISLSQGDIVVDEYTNNNDDLHFEDNSDQALLEKNKEISEEFIKSVLADFESQNDIDESYNEEDPDLSEEKEINENLQNANDLSESTENAEKDDAAEPAENESTELEKDDDTTEPAKDNENESSEPIEDESSEPAKEDAVEPAEDESTKPVEEDTEHAKENESSDKEIPAEKENSDEEENLNENEDTNEKEPAASEEPKQEDSKEHNEQVKPAQQDSAEPIKDDTKISNQSADTSKSS